MAMNGFFLGGAADSMDKFADRDIKQQAETRALGLGTRALDLQQQGQQNTVQQQSIARADKQISDTLAIIGETSQAAIDSGVKPEVIAAKVQPLVDSAKALAQASGRDPSSIDNLVQTLVTRPPSPQKLETVSEGALGDKKTGFVNPRTQTITPAVVAPVAPVPPGQSINLTGPDKTVTGVDVQPVGPQMAQADIVPPSITPEGAKPRNDEFLAKAPIPPEVKAIVKQLVDYEIKPTDLSIRGDRREKLLGLAKLYDPEYDSMGAAARQKAINEFAAGGPSSPAGQITAGNTAILHANEIGRAAEHLKELPGTLSKIANSGIPFVSYAAAQLKNKSVEGTPEGKALSEFMVAKQHFAEEVTKFYSGSQGSEAERDRALRNLDEAKSLTELRAAVAQESTLMADKISAMQDRIKNAMGPRAWLTAIKRTGGDYPIIQEQAQKAIGEIKLRNGMGLQSQPTIAPAAPTSNGVVDYRTYFGKP